MLVTNATASSHSDHRWLKRPAGPLLMAGYQQLPRLQRLPTLDKMKSRFAVRTSLQRRTTRQQKDGVMAGQALGKTVRW
jgi:hypothetical protein